MTRETEHIEFEVLNDYVDGRLDGRATRQVEEHIAGCEQCSRELADLRMLVADVAALPKSVLPPDDIWADLRASIEEGKEVVLPVRAMDTNTSRGISSSRARLAAAAVLLVAASSGLTAIVLRNSDSQSDSYGKVDSGASPRVFGAPVLPASFQVAEGKYVNTIEELRTAFDAQRGQLMPETVRTVDRSLAVIDSAITEARAALLADPGNRTLVDLLSASYQRKLDLLRRTSELTPRT